MEYEQYYQELCEKVCTQFLQGDIDLEELALCVKDYVGDYRLLKDIKDGCD